MVKDTYEVLLQASKAQVIEVMHCLDLFSRASGLKVNLHKSKAQCSKRVSERRKEVLSGVSNIRFCNDLGKYLGINIGHARASRKTAQEFLWKGQATGKGLPLVRWEVAITPKKAGGLGIRDTSCANMALLGKLVWDCLNNSEKLWVQVLKHKYLRNQSGMNGNSRNSSSATWKNIVSAYEHLKEGLHWNIGDVHKSVWYDEWTPFGKLCNLVPYGSNFDHGMRIQYGVPDTLEWGKIENFTPTRGIRQGDPISPYLFVIAMNKLSMLIEDGVEEGNWKPMKAGREGPIISYLLFADDLLLFAEASENQIREILRVLQIFSKASGLIISKEKTSILFSKNVKRDTRNKVLRTCSYREVPCLGRYLGTLLTNSKKNKDNYGNIIKRVHSRLKGWKTRCLSLAGRITLAQSVINPALNFNMQHGKIPIGVCKEIQKCQKRFIWGEEQNTRKIHAINWETLCRPKLQGGLGFRKITIMNEAFLMKLFWRIITQPDALWAQVLKIKYGRGENPFFGVISKSTDSRLWKNIAAITEIVQQNLTVSVGNGKNTSFWFDKWMKNEPPLFTAATQNMNLGILEWKVADLTLGEGS
ncbi:uncharacterized protein [Arachis hypogaea]|uniref:uncharacterized protein n=1 Tax=Arachis hypogaea TaxID=3818 RepID=UPI003B20B7E6